MLLATALALLITGCAQQTFVQNKPAAAAKPSPIISSFLELGERKLSMQPKFVAAQKMLLKQKPSKHSWDCSVYTLGIYTPLEAHLMCAHNNCMSCPSIWATLSALLINILLSGSFQLFLHSDQLSLRVK